MLRWRDNRCRPWLIKVAQLVLSVLDIDWRNNCKNFAESECRRGRYDKMLELTTDCGPKGNNLGYGRRCTPYTACFLDTREDKPRVSFVLFCDNKSFCIVKYLFHGCCWSRNTKKVTTRAPQSIGRSPTVGQCVHSAFILNLLLCYFVALLISNISIILLIIRSILLYI
jgi:hypothetical protein